MKTSDQPYDMPGQSCFLQVDGRVFHTYSQYARGLESTGGSYYFLDLTALGRQEEWEEPKGRSESTQVGHARLRVVTQPATCRYELTPDAKTWTPKIESVHAEGWYRDPYGLHDVEREGFNSADS